MIRRRRSLVRTAVLASLSGALVLAFAAPAARGDFILPGADATPLEEPTPTEPTTTPPPTTVETPTTEAAITTPSTEPATTVPTTIAPSTTMASMQVTGPPTTSAPPTEQAAPVAVAKPVVLAHYYIWFNVSSWNRAKTDFPLVGRYSSDQATVMRTQVRQAKAAGIDGFIVSWKSSDELNRRLGQLVQIAGEEKFKLAITYQALDFNRNPLPAARVASDLDLLHERYGDDPAFKLMGDRPLVVWTGTWSYSNEDIATVTEPRRNALRILASAKNVADYTRVAPLVDGNLYYWSSVDPTTMNNHETKLTDMAKVVRASGGLWIAPAAPGFDARQVGGKSVVERRDGQTLRDEWNAALATSPDAIGIISWNEFSENTQIEPSQQYGSSYLDVVRSLTGAPEPTGDFDSDAPTGRSDGPWNIIVIAAFILFTVGCAVAAIRRTRHVPRHIRRSRPDESYSG